ncbi:hypothetical protein PYCCODRAFT_1443280 [Trametes coccinea BRFM310]|uniref:Uncharacterized protein n=1 Tax=Trametes coccinea (strain BRFM310) TaxID=1353009 RepID=A0A1Y2IW51_TRAC3|nr:hypothetical protein PYCCODRAFT_1443280 [Trametes coccinea BRFM310]
MSQHRFRVNPVKSYAERMTETRSELRRLVRSKLCEITGEPNAQMRWSRNAYMRDVVSRYRVRIEGWPLNEVPFKNLSDVTNLGKMEYLLRGWTEGTIYFRLITDAEFREMIADPSPWIGPIEGLGIDDGPEDAGPSQG